MRADPSRAESSLAESSLAESSLAGALLADLAHAAAVRALPPVQALHLPPAGLGGRDAEFCALELADGALGLSYLLLPGTREALDSAGARGALAARLRGAEALALARGWADPAADSLTRALGFAAVNAISRHVFDRAGFVPPPAGGSVGDLALAPGDHLGMVGLFRPLVDQVLASGAALTVIELQPDLVAEHAGWRVTLDASALRACNKILCTSTVLMNGSFESIARQASAAERFALIGPGAGCLPDALFARGVSLLGGSWITDRAGFLQALAQGKPWGAFARKFALARDGWPGLAGLLGRVQGVQ